MEMKQVNNKEIFLGQQRNDKHSCIFDIEFYRQQQAFRLFLDVFYICCGAMLTCFIKQQGYGRVENHAQSIRPNK